MNHVIGDVFQINENRKSQNGLIGAFILATEIKTWGIQGFVHSVDSWDESSRIYLRLKWEDIDYIGNTNLIPSDEVNRCLIFKHLV